jgi:diguanylate cyclase (GGDEF)-like protein
MRGAIEIMKRPLIGLHVGFVVGLAIALALFPASGASLSIPRWTPTLPKLEPAEATVLAVLMLILVASLVYLVTAKSRSASATVSAKVSNSGLQNVNHERQVLQLKRDEFEQQLNAIFSVVGNYITNTRTFSKSLDDAGRGIGVADSLESVRSIVETLIKENSRVSHETQQLRTRLEDAKNRVENMKQSLDQARLEATTDPLTGVANRRRLDSFLDTAVTRSHEDQLPLCLIMADIDHFKRINDTFGHQAGDLVLERFGRLLKQNTRDSDLVGRYGGEEFAVVLPRTATGSALAIAERLRTAVLQTEFKFGPKPIGRVTASFGVAAIQSSETAAELIARADKKVYEARPPRRVAPKRGPAGNR